MFFMKAPGLPLNKVADDGAALQYFLAAGYFISVVIYMVKVNSLGEEYLGGFFCFGIKAGNLKFLRIG